MFVILETNIAFEGNVSLTLLVHALLKGRVLIRILGIELEQACNGGSCGRISLKRDFEMSFAFETNPRISLICKLVPAQHREYENGLLPLQSSTRGRSANPLPFCLPL